MQKQSIRIMYVFLMFAALFVGSMNKSYTVSAANSTVKIFIGDGTSARHHMSMTKGSTSEEFRFELNGYAAKSSTYTSSNSSAFKIVNTGNGTCKVEGIAEGTGLVTLTVQTTAGKTLTEKVFISICTKLEQCKAVTQKITDVYRGASANSGVENTDKKDSISGNVQITLLSECGNFYRFKTNDGSVFSDDSDTGFIRKSDVKIPVENVIIQEQNISIETGGSKVLHAKVVPDIASDKSLSWNTSNAKVAAVDSSGKVSGITEGTTTISATAKDGTRKQGSTRMSVYSAMTETAGYLHAESKLYKLADGKAERGSAAAKETLVITGQSGAYYRVKLDRQSLYTDGDTDEYCYVLKSNVNIPVESVAFGRDNIIRMERNKSIRLEAIVYPETATNKTITYTSSNPLVVKVDSKGTVTAVKTGVADITVFTQDGGHTAVCRVSVSNVTSEGWAGSKANQSPNKVTAKGKITAKGKDDESILVSWKKFKSVKKYELQRANVGSSKYKTIKKLGKNKKQYVDKKVKFYKQYKYRLLITTTNGKKAYSQTAKARTKDSKVNITLKAVGNTKSSIKLTWNKQKNAKQYIISRRDGKKGEYKEIKKVSAKKNSYVDKNLKRLTNYYYMVKVVKTNKKSKASKAVKSKTKYTMNTADKEKNLKFFREKYPFVCTDSSQNMNEYCVYDNYYSPVKYQFDGKTLKIHLYIEFAKYTGSREKGYKKGKASETDGKEGGSFRDLYKKGVKDNFEIAAVDNEHEFQGIDFQTQVVFHEKGKEKYNNKQYFTEILLGGECPYSSSKGDHWYHEHTAFEETGEIDTVTGEAKKRYFQFARIYLPYDEQLKDNENPNRTKPFNKKDYMYTTAHETGHMLGLKDAYVHQDGYDRFTDNPETGVECKLNKNKGSYDNLMKEAEWETSVLPNDLEMMLYAYQQGRGRPWVFLQCYKTVDELEMTISSCIKNTTDMYPDK